MAAKSKASLKTAKKSKSLELKRELEKVFKRMEGAIRFDGSGADLIREVRRKTAATTRLY